MIHQQKEQTGELNTKAGLKDSSSDAKIAGRLFPNAAGINEITHTVLTSDEAAKLGLIDLASAHIPHKDSKLLETILDELTSSIESKADYYKSVKDLLEYDLIESIFSNLGIDILEKHYDTSTNSFFTVSITPPIVKEDKINPFEKIQQEVQDHITSLRIHDRLYDAIDDFLAVGEYIFGFSEDHDELDEIYEQTSRMPVFKKGVLEGVFNAETKQLDGTPGEFLVFTYKSSSKKLSFKDKADNYYHCRIAKGIIPIGLIEKIKTIRLMERLVPLVQVMNISDNRLYTMNVSIGDDLSEVYTKCANYKNIILSLVEGKELPDNVEDILKKLNDIKVIPVFGDQQINETSLKKENIIDLEFIEQGKQEIKSRLGLMVEDDANAASMSPKYLRLLVFLRNKLAKGVLEYTKGYIKEHYPKNKALEKAIVLIKTPELRGSSELDLLDYNQMLSQTLGDMSDTIGRIADSYTNLTDNEAVDSEVIRNFYNEKLRAIVGQDIFKKEVVKEAIEENV